MGPVARLPLMNALAVAVAVPDNEPPAGQFPVATTGPPVNTSHSARTCETNPNRISHAHNKRDNFIECLPVGSGMVEENRTDAARRELVGGCPLLAAAAAI